MSEYEDSRDFSPLFHQFPEETSKSVTDRTIRFCHIDVDVYKPAKDIMRWLWPKLVAGGIMVFDDYGFQECSGITRMVNGRTL